MIRQNTAYCAMELAEILDKQGIAVTAMPESPVAKLVDSCYCPTLDGSINGLAASTANLQGQESGFLDAMVEASMRPDAAGVVKHDITMDELIETISAAIAQNHDLARNRVNPIIREIVEEVSANVASAKASASQVLTVIQDEYNDVWNTDVIAGLVSKYSETPIRPIGLTLVLPPVDGAFIDTLMKTGSSRLDTDLQALIEKMPPGTVLELYNSLFVPSAQVQRLGGSLNDYISPLLHRDMVLLVHLLARKLLTKIPEGTAVDLDSYRTFMSSVIEQSGRALNRVLEKRLAAEKSKNVVERWPSVEIEYAKPGEGVILVNAANYARWLKEGGTPEILFGSYATDKVGSYDLLLAKADEYKKAWGRQERILQTAARFRSFSDLVSAIRSAMAKQINQMGDDELVVDRATLHTRLNEQMASITEASGKDLYCTVRRLVCQTIFPHTQAEMVLEAVDAAAAANPGLDIREAALLGTVEIMANWLSAMLVVEVNR